MKNIGIWGLGIVGKSAIKWFHSQGIQTVVAEQRTVSEQEQTFLHEHGATLHTGTLGSFLASMEQIVPSPGIDLRPYKRYASKWVAELDLFAAHWKKPLIAITGSVGKTTVTHLLSKALEHNGFHVATGGNIGTGMLDLLAHQNESDFAVLEVSSFQLELCTTFAPDLAIWTNLYPNHLDRHGTEKEYGDAKSRIIINQNKNQIALLPAHLKDQLPNVDHQRYWFDAHTTQNADFYFSDHSVCFLKSGVESRVTIMGELSDKTYEENILILVAALTLLHQPIDGLIQALDEHTVIDHRMELVATKHGATFYNDSKSTIAPATLAAVQKLAGKSIVLFLGGVSKGVDRSSIIALLCGTVKKVYCFGKEAEQLAAHCAQHNVPAHAFATLDEAFNHCIKQLEVDDHVLFSPGGASFDLFAHYQERGAYFKKLVHNLDN